ncbi:MAG: hypothetical protein LC754_10250 [Acidobacteria bacterium]|nr:hypothetical protein [Acidobacteriota bacterium]
MKNLHRILASLLLLSAPVSAAAQRAHTAPPANQQTGTTTGVVTPTPPPAPQTVKAKYEGGLVGYRKSDGTINFDDVNSRLVFKDKLGKEMFSVPYKAVVAAWPDTQSRRTTAGNVIASTVPYGLGLPALFIKKKYRYMVLQYRDPDTKAEGSTSFKLDTKEMLASVLYTFAQKAGLTQRGEAYVRRNDTPTPHPNEQ